MVAGMLVGGCSLMASRDEFAVYRRYRYETNEDRRGAIGAEYLARFGHGRFREQIQRELSAREEAFWEERRSTYEGLQAYLRAYPRGVHAGEAQARIAVYDAERRRLAEERAAAEQAERERQAAERRAALERQRFFARNTMLYWLRTLGALEGWGEPIPTVAQRNPEFNRTFGGEPAPQCRGGRCRKNHLVDFTIPVPGRTALSRQLNLRLDLVLPGRRLRQAMLILPRRGLTTWHECETQSVSDPADPAARQQSVQWAMDQLKGIVAMAFPDARETPPSLVGPEPEMVGNVEDDSGETAQSSQAETPMPPIPPQPLGVQWSYVIGCGNLGGARITVPESARPAGWNEATEPTPPVRSCLRIDAFVAPDIEGVSTDEGLVISWIEPSAVPQAARSSPPARRARPARRTR